MKKIIKFILVFIFLLSLTACAYREPNARFTVTAIGFSANGTKVTAYLQAMDFSKSEDKTFLVTGEGDSVKAAVKDVNKTLSKEPSFEHCSLILLSRGIDGTGLKDALNLCQELSMSQKTRVAYADSVKSALENNTLKNGDEIASLIKENSKTFGFGKHTALFEIKTAVLVNDGNFALVNLDASNSKIKFDGLLEYKNCKAVKSLNFEESRQYAKEQLK